MARIRSTVVLGAALLIGAIAAFLIGQLTDSGDSAARIGGFHRLAFGSGDAVTVELSSGTWVGYYEAPGTVTSAVDVPNFRAFIRDSQNAQVNVGNYAAPPIRYTYGGKSGLAILQFEAPQSGRYRIALQGVGSPPPGADLAIGRDVSGPQASESRVPIVVEALVASAGVGLLGWSVVQRSRRPHVVSGAS